MAGQGGSEKSGEQTIPKYMHDIYIYILTIKLMD